MTGSARDDVDTLLTLARALYEGDARATGTIDALERRLHEPLRLALAGMVKAGKSTLLNAMLGEQIAPTDAGECTKVITWYRHALTPAITVNMKDEPSRRMPIRRDDGRLVLDLGDTPAEDIESIEIAWPLDALKSMVLIDTPGIASLSTDISARTTTFLAPEESPGDADAVIYLMRHVHAADLAFLEALRGTSGAMTATTWAVGVLSRADEIGSGRIDSLLSSAKVARRYEAEAGLRSLVLGVVPVAGLLAEGARTLREREFLAFRELAGLDRDTRERLLVSADRFVRDTGIALPANERTELLERFGMFGIRLAAALIRAGAQTSSELSEQLVAQSGLIPLQDFVTTQFAARAEVLKVRGVLAGLDMLLTAHPPRGETYELRAGIERVEAGAHGLRELSLLSTVHSDSGALDPDDWAEALQIIGSTGTSVRDRLGLPDDAADAVCEARARELLSRWRGLAESPLIERPDAAACQVVCRSLDAVLSEIAPGRTGRPLVDVVTPG